MKRVSLTVQMTTLIVLAGVLIGCEEATPPPEVERVRAIKPYYVSDPAGSDVRRYSGTIVAAHTSALGFAVAGTIKTVQANAGDHVKIGQTLATLEPNIYALNVQSAEAELKSQSAELKQVRQDIVRQQALYKKGWIAKAAYEKTTAQLSVAEEARNLARARLGLAEQDLTKTRLTAPFDGIISERAVDPFVEVSTGQKIFQIDSEGALEADISISDSVISRIAIGSPVSINTAAVPGCGCHGRITEIGAQAGAANAVSVKAAILDGTSKLLPGMAVEVSVILSGNTGTTGPGGFLVPLVAIAPGDAQAKGYVFKFDQKLGVVRKTAIVGNAGIDGNMIGVSEGVDAGDILAAAGVSFLRDGQRVKLMDK